MDNLLSEGVAVYPILPAEQLTVITEPWFKVLAERKSSLVREWGGRAPFIATFGSALIGQESAIWQSSYKLGVELARAGAIVLNGGYGGLMEATAAGARSVGGITVGITCENLPEKGPNPYILHEWKVERWDQRLIALVWLADGYVILPGSSGTLVELAMVIETQLKGFIPPRPVVCLTRFWQPVVRRVLDHPSLVKFAPTPNEVVRWLREHW